MLIFGKNVLYELDKKLIKKVYVSRKDYLDYLQKNNIKYDFVDNFVIDKMVKGNHQGIVIETYDYEYKKINSLSDVDRRVCRVKHFNTGKDREFQIHL